MTTTRSRPVVSSRGERAAGEQRHAERFEIAFGDPGDVGVLRCGRIGGRPIETHEAGALPVVGDRHRID